MQNFYLITLFVIWMLRAIFVLIRLPKLNAVDHCVTMKTAETNELFKADAYPLSFPGNPAKCRRHRT